MTSHQYLDPFTTFVELFNARWYHACIAPLEELWFVKRDDFHKALIRMCVGCNQIRLDLDSGQRFLLTTAGEPSPRMAIRTTASTSSPSGRSFATALAVLDTPTPRVVRSFQIEPSTPS